jgi:hypothetical protein
VTVDKEEESRLLGILERHGVSPSEEGVLGIVRYKIPLPPPGIASYAKNYEQYGHSIGVHPFEDYLQAVDSCIAKGWLTILTEEDLDRDAERRRRSPIPEMSEEYTPGAVAFTEAGFFFFHDLLREMFDHDYLDQEYSCKDWNEDEQRIDIYAITDELCRSEFEYLQEYLTTWTGMGRPVRVSATEAPRPIGAWKPERFITLPSGFHAVIKFELLPEGEEVPKVTQAAAPPPPSDLPPGKKLLVGNLPPLMTADHLRIMFSPHGVVRSAEMTTNGETNAGIVEMSTEMDALVAITALDGAMIDDRSITVAAAE